MSPGTPRARGTDEVEAALDEVRAGLPPGRPLADVLEVGCGDGAFAERLRAACPGVALLAVDSSQRCVELTRERGVPAQLMDVEELLPGYGSYDVVVALDVLGHVGDLDRALTEVRRVLRSAGRLVVTVADDDVEAALRRHFADVRRGEGAVVVATGVR